MSEPPTLVLAALALFLLASEGCVQDGKAGVEETYEPPATAYSYVASAERAAQIRDGFGQLRANQTRAQVRGILGPPDYAFRKYGDSLWNAPFTGWYYCYRVRMRMGSPNIYDEQVEIFFDEKDRLYWAVPDNLEGLTALRRAEAS